MGGNTLGNLLPQSWTSKDPHSVPMLQEDDSSSVTSQPEAPSLLSRISGAFSSSYVLPLLAGLAVVTVGLSLGLTAPVDDAIPIPYDRVSCVMGWFYFAAWSVSLYPQVYANWARKSVEGLSFDFLVYSLIGFLSYSVYTVSMYCSSSVRDAYRVLHGSDNDVAPNDVFFALHALVVTAITLVQCAMYNKGQQAVSRLCKAVCVVVAVGALAGAAVIKRLDDTGASDAQIMWLNYMYAMSFLKLASTIVKYIPQVIANHTTRSTKGWSIGGVMLDIVGGVLSIGQSVLDSVVRDDWGVLMGNPIRFAIGFYSIFFDTIFMLQHYVWFKDTPESPDEEAVIAKLSAASTSRSDLTAAV